MVKVFDLREILLGKAQQRKVNHVNIKPWFEITILASIIGRSTRPLVPDSTGMLHGGANPGVPG